MEVRQGNPKKVKEPQEHAQESETSSFTHQVFHTNNKLKTITYMQRPGVDHCRPRASCFGLCEFM